ncbi:D-alanyl-D-alanine carboxypeptidase family protein [Nonomuraea sp. B12E4]|uniref:D-alanyl-D-alanine carboxypeptidase family protein n=1 Tax=Nonomuraea sp. B12E4 TaxID=3153564 RepID=UPI00325F0078
MRIGGFIVSAALALVVGVSTPAVAVARETAAHTPKVTAKAAYVVDSTGTIHFGKQETTRLPVASLVKVMTAYVVLREARLSDTITITATDVKYGSRDGATTAGLKAGERLTVRDLLYGLLLPSGADAANALARRYGPGRTAFVAKMNRAAQSLGLDNTRYTNADGMPDPDDGTSTAVDQARLAQHLLESSTFRTVVGTKVHKVAKSAVHRAHTWHNSNKLLSQASGVLGVKTGYIRAAGYCLLFAGERGGEQVVGVLLGGKSSEGRFTTAEQLLDYAGDQITGR